jgi:hypothetical protein
MNRFPAIGTGKIVRLFVFLCALLGGLHVITIRSAWIGSVSICRRRAAVALWPATQAGAHLWPTSRTQRSLARCFQMCIVWNRDFAR